MVSIYRLVLLFFLYNNKNYYYYYYNYHYHHHHHLHEVTCPVLPLPSMFPISQLSPPILTALLLPFVFFCQISLPNSSSMCTCPLLSAVWNVSFLQLSCSCTLSCPVPALSCPASSSFNYFGFMINFLKFVFKP